MSDEHDNADDWLESTEGDLDPDLTEEAGYLAWAPHEGNNWFPFVARLLIGLVVVALIGTVILPAFV